MVRTAFSFLKYLGQTFLDLGRESLDICLDHVQTKQTNKQTNLTYLMFHGSHRVFLLEVCETFLDLGRESLDICLEHVQTNQPTKQTNKQTNKSYLSDVPWFAPRFPS
jgi:hypothetical protein